MSPYSLVYHTIASDLIKQGWDKNYFNLIAGPCAVEDEQSLLHYVNFIQSLGINYLRAGVFKPRTSPYDFQGLGYEGLEILKRVKNKTKIKIVTEIVSASDLNNYEGIVDIVQIGARNMQNFELLKAIGKTKKPVILKRGFGNTIEEWLGAAEYILSAGNPNVIFCERGIKTFENLTRNTLDLSSVAILKKITSLPVIVDPSHATGRGDIIIPLSLASIAAGSDGLLIEIHHDPIHALSDGPQALIFEQVKTLIKQIDAMLPLFNKIRN